jgi:hypothetical protein
MGKIKFWLRANIGILFLVLLSCNVPKAIVEKSLPAQMIPAENPHDIFIFLRQNADIPKKYLLGSLKTRHNGFTGNCGLEEVEDFAMKTAKAMGGNIMVITQHKYPNTIVNPCHSIQGTVFRVPKPSLFEKEILWTKNRKLDIADFKGSTEKRPFVAATMAYFGYTTSYDKTNKSFTMKVETRFSCEDSYFKKSEKDSFNLAHEQLHFDIVELYARKLAKEVQYEINNFEEYQAKISNLGNKVNQALQLEQDAYDTDVYADINQQYVWEAKIKKALEEYGFIQQKTITKPYK